MINSSSCKMCCGRGSGKVISSMHDDVCVVVEGVEGALALTIPHACDNSVDSVTETENLLTCVSSRSFHL